MENVTESAINVNAAALEAFAQKLLLAAGFDELSSRTAAEGLVQASLRGVDSHGIRLLPHYVKALKAGRLTAMPKFEFEQTGPTTGIINADHALGFPAGQTAIDKAMEIAAQQGMAAVTVTNSSHCGMLAYYTIQAAKNGFFALAVTNTTPRLIPTGSKKAFLGTNPFCYAFPLQNEEPLCYDAATTQITGNKIQLYRQLGLALPDGVAADKDGNITTDAKIAELLVPFGDYKGFGIALLVDILCGALCGMPNGDQVSAMYGSDISGKRLLGQFYLVFDINRFRPLQAFAQELQEEMDRLRALPSVDGRAIMAPGDPEKLISAERAASGIPLEPEIFASLQSVADELNVTGINEIILN
ncbi:Ldh family oxidoreductase [Mucilaginibacter sp. UR6-1]|uniref:Ldh family oxidoreductase n=1 Tax=Mucilaginibacter sp. UR6-1 TaxID=1435643 RepID=UPI001E4ECC03|nr:Ldh family oxidoreductase [Mucilaginibacter sp. UR6-1]MCC8409594.1 Ldh family oxidoreductase [Mucilaginibacter sp. UR6-1]